MIGWLIAGLIAAMALPDPPDDTETPDCGNDGADAETDPVGDTAARIDASVLYPDDDPEDAPAPPAAEAAAPPLLPVEDPEAPPADGSGAPDSGSGPGGADADSGADERTEPGATAPGDRPTGPRHGIWAAYRQR